ncbi:amino acid permease [Lysobacter sp. K5869]|uniref:amino acid permease n=1 Tax=Lysobacter sp. K5869 TaxID=2820808 RepID=UPI001C05F77B|nr:amino acid permease [Lysobacter sp. K5869]QWP75852.1 amino acid permease [Lysobacter sp. K5869]
MSRGLFITKPVGPAAHVDAGEIHGSLQGEGSLKRALTAKHLVMLGIGGVIGAGIFVLTGQAAAIHAGPAVVLSFIFAGIACAFAGLCYAEFAAMLPVSGSAYSYSYATLGELVAWFIGWNLVLEYLFAASTVAVGWSGYFNELLQLISTWIGTDVTLPKVLASAPYTFVEGHIQATGTIINLPAVCIVAALSGLCYVGITQSAFINSIIVAIKLVVILLFLAFAIRYINPGNWTPFIPPNEGPGQFGWSGVYRAASVVFFSYIGFDAVSTAAGEAKNPQRDMPIGILGSLFICTILYVLVSLTLTGIADFRTLNTPEPVATALSNYASLDWLRTIVVLGALAGLSSVVLVMLMGQPRIFFTMSQDGLIPKVFSKVHPKFQTPYVGTIIVGIFACAIAGLFPIDVLGQLVSMGTLLAFATVCIGVLVLRYTRPDLHRPFKVPFVWGVCVLGAAACLFLFWQAFAEHWRLMVGWTIIGFAIYLVYGYRNSKLRKAAGGKA